jgi:hypothetical protein
MRNHYELNIPFQITRDDIKLPDISSERWPFKVIPAEEVLTSESLAWFTQLGVPIVSTQLFKGAPYGSTRIHIDGRILEDGSVYIKHCWAINIVLGADSSTMRWYRPRNSHFYTEGIGPTGNKHPRYDPNNVEIVNQFEVGHKPFLCHIAVPHSVTNHTDKDRWCLSIRARAEDVDMSWDDACNLFKNYLDKDYE